MATLLALCIAIGHVVYLLEEKLSQICEEADRKQHEKKSVRVCKFD